MTRTHMKYKLAGAVSLLLFAIVLTHYNLFLTEETWGTTLLWSMLGVCLLSALALCVSLDLRRVTKVIIGFFLLLVAPVVMMGVVEALNGNNFFSFSNELFLENYAVYLLVFLLFYGITGRFSMTLYIVPPMLLLFGVANYFVKEFKGGPLVPMDFVSVGTAANVAGGYTYALTWQIVTGIVLAAFLIACGIRLRKDRPGKKTNLCIRIFCLLAVGVMGWVFYGTDTVADYGLKPDFFNQTRGYKNYGAVLSFTLNTKYLYVAKPAGYDAEKIPALVEDAITDESGDEQVDNILISALTRQGETEAAKAASNTPAAGTTPNMIVVMDESFCELKSAGDFETNIPYMPFIDSMQENTIQGNLYVSTIGTGTSNTEFEFLTGNTMGFLAAGSNAYELYVKDKQPSLVSTLGAQGYSRDAMHPYYASSWNRVSVYNLLGFHSFITIEDMIDQSILDQYKSSGYSYSLYKRLLKQAYPDQDIILRRYVSDAYDFDKIIEMYEARDETAPFFLFNITMQNHSSYNQSFDNFDQEVELTSMEGDYPKVDQYLSLVKVTDGAFEDLVSYFSAQESPTIILFFGDHQPFIEDSFYEELMGASLSELSDEKDQNRYITRFVLWANYDIPEGYIDELSTNYLSTLLLQTAGVEMPDYNKYLANLYTDIPVITGMGCRDAAGNYFHASAPTEACAGLVKAYRQIQYNNLLDYAHRADGVFYLSDFQNSPKSEGTIEK